MDFLRETEGAPFFSALTNATPAIPTLFDFNGHTIRVVELDGTPWFVAADVCKALTIGSAAQAEAISNLGSTEVRDHRINGGQRGRPNKMVTEAGEEKTIEGWLIYGAALNEGRLMFPKGDNKRFSEWLSTAKLAGVHDHDREAAMWAAGNPEQVQETHKAHPRVRTVRGLLAGH